MDNPKGTEIYVRGRKHEFDGEKIRYMQVVDLGYPNGKRGPNYEYDVTWKDGPKDTPNGSLKEERLRRSRQRYEIRCLLH